MSKTLKAKVTYKGEIPKPKVGDIFSGWGIGGRSGFWQSSIVEVHDDHIILKTSPPHRKLNEPRKPDVIDNISMERYIVSHLISTPNDTTTVSAGVIP